MLRKEYHNQILCWLLEPGGILQAFVPRQDLDPRSRNAYGGFLFLQEKKNETSKYQKGVTKR